MAQKVARHYREWKIGVLSTDYDLRDERKAVIRKLRSLGFAPVAFELSDYPVQPSVNSHEACLLAIKTVDIAILILKKRYGGLYCGGDISITEAEANAAFRQGIIIIPCVAKSLYDDRHNSKRRVEALVARGYTKREARQKVKPEYAEKWQLLDFLDRIQHQDHDQFMIFFTTHRTLTDQIADRLRAISPHICRLLVNAQKDAVEAERSAVGKLISLGRFNAELHIRPHATVSGTNARRKTLEQGMAELRSDKRKTLFITASPGGGKTVEITRAFCAHAKYALQTKSFTIPFFVSLKGLGVWYHFDFMKYLHESFNSVLQRDIYPCISTAHIKPVFYIDGLDEGVSMLTPERGAAFNRLPMLEESCAVTSRIGFARQFVEPDHALLSNIDLSVQLLDWTPRDATRLAVQYMRLNRILSDKDVVLNYIRDLSWSHPIVRSPLILSLFLSLVAAEGAREICNEEIGLSTLFERFLESYATRELARINKRPGLSKDLLSLWEYAAWVLFRARENGERLSTSEFTKRLAFCRIENCTVEELTALPAFGALFQLSHNDGVVNGMIHEQFMEYLLARWFVKSAVKSNAKLSEYLAFQMNVDANRFIKAIWRNTPAKELGSTLRRIGRAATHRTESGHRDLARHANCVYYISRIPLPGRRSAITLQNLLANERRTYCRNGILFALTRLGDMGAEEKLYQSISTNSFANRLNRGLHLEYFKDVRAGSLGTPAKDGGLASWERCLLGLLDHLSSEDTRFVYTRRIELFTIRSFVESRNHNGPLDTRRISIIKRNAFHGLKKAIVSREYRNKIADELDKLLNLATP